MKTIKNFSLFAVFMAFVSLVIYACSAGQNDWEQDMENELELKTAMSRSAKAYTRLDSIAESDEYLDYVISINNLLEKAKQYVSDLNDEELLYLRNNIENEDYIHEVWKRADLQTVYEEMLSKEKLLLENTMYAKLTESERIALYSECMFFTNQISMKTRKTEQECNDAYDKKMDKITQDFIKEKEKCNIFSGDNKRDCINAATIWAGLEQNSAYKELQDCLEEAKKDK